jgi:hypothetical protein
MKKNHSSFLAFLILCITVHSYGQMIQTQSPYAISTYHCIGLYWSPSNGSQDRDVIVEYRKSGESRWKEGLNMVYHPVEGTEKDRTTYRGSIVNLLPNNTYEIRLSLEGTSIEETFQASTWNEFKPEGETIIVGNLSSSYNINISGTSDAYVVYDGKGAVIDVMHKQNSCIEVESSYVILRNFTLRGAGDTSTVGNWPPIGAINILQGSDIIIEDCDISDWGRPNANPSVPNQGNDYESAILSRNESISRVTIQRNKMHHPTYQSNSWKDGLHPQGPQCLGFWNSQGNHVIRYNEGWSDENHYYNDIIGAGANGSYGGFPGDDSDIYGNYFANCWDDGIESEGANQNVRIWNNYISNTLMAIGNAATSIGPLYVWRNVSYISHSPLPNYTYGNFMKMGFAGSINWMTGTMYVFHNTIYQGSDEGNSGLGGSRRILRHCTSRNNILSVVSSSSHSIANSDDHFNNDFDYDLYNREVPSGSEAHGVVGTPAYIKGVGFDFDAKSGNFQLQPGSPGVDAGEIIPNFSDGYSGKGPDMGAHERGWENFEYGIRASFLPQEKLK